MQAGGDPTDLLRLELVGVRAELRTARQDLARKKRAVTRAARLTARTVKERESELELLVYGDPDVMALEDLLLELEHREDLATAKLENARRVTREYEWFVRERMADSNNEVACAMATSTIGRLVIETVSSYGERSSYVGGSGYMHERELE